jgi:dipeptidase
MARNIGIFFTVALASFIISQSIVAPSAEAGCFSVVVGRDASADGSVIMAHNEDDSPPQVVHHRKIPRKEHDPNDVVVLTNGGVLKQVEETWAYIWAEMPGMTFSDSYLNEWGVAIASDNCPSREDNPEFTDEGINYMLRRLIVERSKTARDGVLLAGKLVERFGYDASGRTYVICDPNEGWLFCAINGKHWLAKRVPDDEVAIIANTLTIREVDLDDSDNFLASEDIIDYAVSRGWYDPDGGAPFDFAAAYAAPDVAADSANICRQWRGLELISPEPIPLGTKLPFSVKPDTKLSVSDVMEILRDHYEGTDMYGVSEFTGSPHEGVFRPICCWSTQTSFVAQLRNDIPLDIGIVYWMSLAPPCASFYIPFHFGIDEFPVGYATDAGIPEDDALEKLQATPFEVVEQNTYQTFYNFYLKIHDDHNKFAKNTRAEVRKIEKRAFSEQGRIEEAALKLYESDKTSAMSLLANYSRGLYHSACEAMTRVIPKE